MKNDSTKPLKYQSELLRVTNLVTGAKSFYVRKCGTMARISQAEYDKRYDEADGFSCVHQKSTKTHYRSFITASYTG